MRVLKRMAGLVVPGFVTEGPGVGRKACGGCKFTVALRRCYVYPEYGRVLGTNPSCRPSCYDGYKRRIGYSSVP